MKRSATYETWEGKVGKARVSACNEDVDKMFDGLTNALRAKFEISTIRPRYQDYHTFVWSSGCYRAREIIRGWTPCLVRDTSAAIYDRLIGEKRERIFVTAL